MELDDKYIINELKNSAGKFNGKRTTKEYLVEKGFYDYILNRYSDNTTDSIMEILYRMDNNIESVPICKTCGNKVVFDLKKNRYPIHCSRSCSQKDPDTLMKNSKSVSEAMKKRYEIKKEEIAAKSSETLEKNTGEKNNGFAFSCKSVQDKVKATLMDRYGESFYRVSDEERRRGVETENKKRKEKWKERGLDVDYTDHKTIIVHHCCETHGDIEMDISVFNNRTKKERLGKTVLCTVCNPVKTKDK